MKLGLFGGTFDPPHISHTLACLYILETTDVERILVVPCYRHPLGKQATSFQDRASMSRLAMKSLFPRVEISEIESERSGPSFTIDTLRILKERMPGSSFSLIIGSDIVEETHLWKSYDEIRKLARILVLPRPGRDEGWKKGETGRFFLPDISSTEIRRQLLEGADVSPFLSSSVMEYIESHRLYLETSPCEGGEPPACGGLSNRDEGEAPRGGK